MSNRPPVLDVIATKVLPSRCPACGFAGELVTDGKWPATTRVECPHRCGWFARYRLREVVADA